MVDVLGPCAVVQSCAAWVERYRPQVCAAVAAAAGISADSIVWRPATEILKEEVRGWRGWWSWWGWWRWGSGGVWCGLVSILARGSVVAGDGGMVMVVGWC